MASRMVYVNDLVTVDLISRRRKTSVGHITSIIKGKASKKQDFPQPIVGWGCRGVWLWSDVDAWFKKQDAQVQKREEAKRVKEKYRNHPS